MYTENSILFFSTIIMIECMCMYICMYIYMYIYIYVYIYSSEPSFSLLNVSLWLFCIEI